MKPPTYLADFHYKVGQFWTAFELPKRKTWMDASSAGMELAANLVQEEFNEYLNAPTKVEKLDGTVDLLYVLLGACHAIGKSAPALQYKVNYETPSIAGNIAIICKELRSGQQCCWRLVDDALPAAVTQTASAGEALGNFPQAFKAVHAANMGKLWAEPNDDETLFFKKAPVGWLCRRTSDGKVVKPPTFKHPDLSKFLK